jgi:hypothetical protein
VIEAIKTVLAGAVGIRRRAAHERAQVSPLQIVVVGIVFVVLFVLGIRTLVHFVTS